MKRARLGLVMTDVKSFTVVLQVGRLVSTYRMCQLPPPTTGRALRRNAPSSLSVREVHTKYEYSAYVTRRSANIVMNFTYTPNARAKGARLRISTSLITTMKCLFTQPLVSQASGLQSVITMSFCIGILQFDCVVRVVIVRPTCNAYYPANTDLCQYQR